MKALNKIKFCVTNGRILNSMAEWRKAPTRILVFFSKSCLGLIKTFKFGHFKYYLNLKP
jgi:hypothetical protein